uniref:Uncharacterized protein n=1 Tax=Leersia perrieri TaxID=77586 RepID=A0A0D9XFD7_9ORYZ
MGKKVKTKGKNPRKAQQQQQREPTAAATPSDAGSEDAAAAAVVQDAGNSTEEAAGPASASGREQCGHYGGDSAKLDMILLEIMSSKHFASCEHCRDDAPRKKGGGGGGKEKGGKQQKKKGGGPKGATAKKQAKAQKSDIWVCLDCGRHFCGGEVDMSKPYGHARRHAKQDRHWWAARFDDPTVAFCLSCEKEVSIEMPRIETVAAAPAEVGGAVDRDIGLFNLHGSVIRGLPNLGNTCFFNAVMQSLLALDRLRNKMLGPDVPTGALLMSLKKLFIETSASNDVGGALSPKNLFSNICSKYPQFRGYQMQDSHELLRCFLDGLHTEEIEARKLADEPSSAGVPTIVDSIFGGQLSSTVSSTECTHNSVKHDQFLDLSLPVPSRRPPAKSVSSPPAKRTKQSLRDRNKNRRYGKIVAQVSPTIEASKKEKIQTVAECNDSQIPGSELGQVVSEKEPEPSECSESCASVPNQEQTGTSNVEDGLVGDIWLDYLDDADEAKSEILDSANSTEAGQIWEDGGVVIYGPPTQDDALLKEQVLGSEHSGENHVDDGASSQPVILLPYKEFGSTPEEMDGTTENPQKPEDAVPPPAVSPLTEDNTLLASVGDGDQDDYAGLGDMFNEPEATSEVKKDTGTVEDINVMAWSSNSAEDEVDDSNAPVSVEGCLALFTEAELLSEPWHCEHCSNSVACANTIDGKDDEMVISANERKDGEEMMAGGDETQGGDKLIANCIEKEGIDQNMATDGCSDNLNAGMNSKEGGCANSSLAGADNSCDANFPEDGEVALLKTGTLLVVDKTEQENNKAYHLETRDLNNSAVEYTSSSKPSQESAQRKDERNVDVASEETTAPQCCDNESASCSTTSKNEVECGAGAEEIVTSSLPSETQRILPGERDNEDVVTRNQGRRKRMKMLGKAHQGQDNQNEQKESGKKVFRAAMRRILISKAPPVLTINLNRFSQDSHGRFKKLKGHVRFKETLDVRPFMDPRSEENKNTTYRLVGVVEHSGTITGGHYVAFVRTGKIGGRQQRNTDSKSWFYASDAQVRESSLEEVLRCEAYILFYERVGD